MGNRSIDALNIGLMLLSCLLAFLFPFQLFLFSFAVLGPLHYFTEIPWLHQRSYFAKGKFDYLLLVGICVGIGTLHYLSLRQDADIDWIILVSGAMAFTAFFGSLVMTTVGKRSTKILLILGVMSTTLLFPKLGFMGMLFANLVPTIVHVYLFTACFILLGALRSRSATGILSLFVFVGCTMLLLLVTPEPYSNRELTLYVKKSYVLFAGLNLDLMSIFGPSKITPTTPGVVEILFTSDFGIIIMRIIAFSYTYHFLNWFSKTSIIKWHLVPKGSLAIVIGLWLLSLALYAYDFNIGLQVLFFLSLLHVTLEYPLNQRTFIGIGTELKGLIAGGGRWSESPDRQNAARN